MKRKIFRSLFVTALMVLVLTAAIILPLLSRQMAAEKHRMLREEARVMAVILLDGFLVTYV